MIDFELEDISLNTHVARIKVLGVGGGGSNMVNSMIASGYENVDFIVANTDAQALKTSKAAHKIQLGLKSTKGLGAGANPEVGRRSAEEDIDSILSALKGADIVFLTGGMGGGTGSGALPVIARALKERDILTIGIVTKPFTFEGKRRMKVAQDALDLLKREIDTLIVMPNQKLIEVAEQKISLMVAFEMINGILNQFVKAVDDIISKPGHINVDFADIKTIMKQKGYAVIGSGCGIGENGAREAAIQAVSSPLLDNMQMSGARGLLVNISGSSNLGLHEMHEAVSIIYDHVHDDAIVVLGSVLDESLGDEISVTVIATGFAHPTAELTGITKESTVQVNESYAMVRDSYVQDKHATKQNIEILNSSSKSGTQVSQEMDAIDLNNLDIPTIMRKSVQEYQQN